MTNPSAFSHLCVLVVGNKTEERDQLCDWLLRLGIDSLVLANSADEAHDLLRDSQYNVHVVFMDQVMPHKDGLDLVCLIRSTYQLDHVKLAMVCGDISAHPSMCSAESNLLAFLKRRHVLPVTRKGLDQGKLHEALRQLTV